jgi:enamine deaminase RidA (YjgF/YER057c/UK114 family)
VNYATGDWPDRAADQTRLALENIEMVLGKFGMTLADVVHCELFYVDPEAWTQAMPVVAARFQGVAAAHIALQAPMPVAQMKVEFQITAWSDRPTPTSPEILVAGDVV